MSMSVTRSGEFLQDEHCKCPCGADIMRRIVGGKEDVIVCPTCKYGDTSHCDMKFIIAMRNMAKPLPQRR